MSAEHDPDLSPDDATGLGLSAQQRRATGLRVYARLTAQDERGLADLSEAMGTSLATMVIDHCLGELWERPFLDLRTRSLVLVGALTAMGDTRALRTHVRGALAHGATKAQLREIFVFLSGYAGFPRATGAAEVAESVFAEMSSDAAVASTSQGDRTVSQDRGDMEEVPS